MRLFYSLKLTNFKCFKTKDRETILFSLQPLNIAEKKINNGKDFFQSVKKINLQY